ncbi:hypothetical protein BGE01nite_04640 [Brevifollis gellanilyticus]|uniref:Uncharacterized protein n=1 Tax=Brevifollis gellanilyticus TaxID=748831 RepID=A0A512M362_9BACT|nr:hypothetical protein BGE01nite_04640 [Brevifollis gellanilyticus]
MGSSVDQRTWKSWVRKGDAMGGGEADREYDGGGAGGKGGNGRSGRNAKEGSLKPDFKPV